jgi:hypothetical protein
VTQANIGYFKFRLGNGASTETFADIEEAFSISGVGKTREQVDATNFDSAGNREYIGGLADGNEVTVECNYIPNATNQAALIAAVEAGLNRNFQVAYTAVSPEEVWQFTASPLSWVINPSVDGRNSISFTVKISGDITDGS